MVVVNKSAYEMFIDGDEPPSRYIVKESKFGSIGSSSTPEFPIPVIDISLLPTSVQEQQKLRSALCSWGCFQAMGHGISETYLDKVRDSARRFFELPLEEKNKISRVGNDGEGYGADLIVSEKQILDWSDRLVLKLLPEDERRLNLWPQNPADFREIINEYGLKIKTILDILFKAVAKSLDLEEDSLLNQFGERLHLIGRFNFYPPCPRPDEVLGLKPHSDKSGITVLLQDKQVEGLQVLKDDQWFRVPIIPHALVVNVGDQMQVMTNGIIKSPIHRAVTDQERVRISVAVSNEPEPEKEIGPEEGLIDENRPRLYRNVKNYAAVNFECFQKGEVAIDTIKIINN